MNHDLFKIGMSHMIRLYQLFKNKYFSGTTTVNSELHIYYGKAHKKDKGQYKNT